MWSHSTSSPTTSTWVTRSRATGSIVPTGGQVKEIRAINVVIVSRNCCHVLQAPANIAGDYPGHSPLKQPRILLLEGNLSHRPHIVPGDMHVLWYNYYFKLWPVLGCLLSWRGWAGGGPIIMTLKHRTERQGACGHHPAMASVPISSVLVTCCLWKYATHAPDPVLGGHSKWSYRAVLSAMIYGGSCYRKICKFL